MPFPQRIMYFARFARVPGTGREDRAGSTIRVLLSAFPVNGGGAHAQAGGGHVRGPVPGGGRVTAGTAGAAGRALGFKRHLRAEVRAGKGAYLFSEQGVIAMRGPHIESLAERLDGTRELADL